MAHYHQLINIQEYAFLPSPRCRCDCIGLKPYAIAIDRGDATYYTIHRTTTLTVA